MKINHLLTNMCSDYLEQSKLFYTALFDFTVNFDSEWFVPSYLETRNWS